MHDHMISNSHADKYIVNANDESEKKWSRHVTMNVQLCRLNQSYRRTDWDAQNATVRGKHQLWCKLPKSDYDSCNDKYETHWRTCPKTKWSSGDQRKTWKSWMMTHGLKTSDEVDGYLYRRLVAGVLRTTIFQVTKSMSKWNGPSMKCNQICIILD